MAGWLIDVSVNEVCLEADLLEHRVYLEHRTYVKRAAVEVANGKKWKGKGGSLDRAAEGRSED